MSKKTKKCSTCHASISKDARTCPNCGEPFTLGCAKTFLLAFLIFVIFMAILAMLLRPAP